MTREKNGTTICERDTQFLCWILRKQKMKVSKKIPPPPYFSSRTWCDGARATTEDSLLHTNHDESHSVISIPNYHPTWHLLPAAHSKSKNIPTASSTFSTALVHNRQHRRTANGSSRSTSHHGPRLNMHIRRWGKLPTSIRLLRLTPRCTSRFSGKKRMR